jgi:type II secretory pathway component PulC
MRAATLLFCCAFGSAALATPAAKKTTVQCRGSRCTVPHESVDRLFGDKQALSKTCRLVPGFRDGKLTGFRLLDIGPSSILAELGLQNGDTVWSLNDHELDGPESAMQAYTTLRSAKKIMVVFDRNGAQRALEIEILGR